MALSVKRFIHENDCPEPSEQINVMYHPTDPQVLCDGGGTLTALFGEAGDLFNLSMGSDDGLAGQGGVCAEGMDVVFVVDYTGSMSGAISGVKTGISNLISTIDTESNSNYRLGLVLFDGGSCNYNTSNFYNSLPANQKINESCDKIITCVEKMSTVGNSTSFTNGLNSIDTTDMPMGASVEWGLTAISEVVNNGFAGSFRNGVQKLIILITDDAPQKNMNYATALKSQLDAGGFQVMYNTSSAAHTRYEVLLETQPAGDGHYNLNYNSTWTDGLELSITSLCESTFIYTCEPPAIGYYMEPGDTSTWWYTGSSWNGPINCEYTVKVNLHTASGAQNYEIADIPTDHYAYLDSNTFEFTGYAGLGFNIDLWLLEAADDWSITEINSAQVQTVSGSLGDFTIYTNPVVTGATYNPLIESDKAFGFDGTITGDAEYNVYISAKVQQDIHAFSITVISDEPDGTNADGEAQDPDGTILLDPQTPATSWLNVSSSYPSKFQATKYTFLSNTGTTHSFDVNFDQNPSDYEFTLNSVGPSYSHPAAQTALQNNWTANSDGITGSFDMPQGGGSAFFYLDAQVNQPEYTFTLQLSENISAAGIIGGNFSQSSWYGYTGDTIPWISNLYLLGNYDSFTITSGNMSSGVSLNTGSGSGIGEVITTNTNIGGNIIMPAGGGSGSGVFSGTSVESQYVFDLSITDDFFVGDYGADFTVTGTVGQVITRTKTLQGASADVTYAIDKITSSSSSVAVTASGTTLTIKVTMPSGGGSGDISVEGSETSNNYSYTVTWDADDSTNGELYGWSGSPTGRTRQTTVTGTAGQTFTVKPPVGLITIQDYFSQAIGRGTSPQVTIQPGAPELTNAGYTTLTQTSGTNSITEGILPEVVLTMPSGGGSATVGTLLVPAQMSYSFAVSFATDSTNSGVIAHTCSGGTDSAGVSRSSISGGSQVISFAGFANAVWTGVQVPVGANDNINYDNEINSITAASGFFNLSGVSATEGSNYCGADREFASFNFKMPSLDPRHGINYNARSVVIDDTVTARTLSFTLTSVHSISNTSITYADITQTFTGVVGSQHNYTSRYYANSGYTLNLTGVTDDSSAVTSSVSGNNVTGVITMPSGGGTGRITAEGNTTLDEFTHTVTIAESVANATLLNNSGGKRVISFTGAPGSTKRFTGEALSIQSGYHYTSGPTVTGNSSLTSSSISASGAMDITITIGSANISSSLSVTGTTAITSKSLYINYSENVAGAIITSGGGTGYNSYSGETVSGTPGSSGQLTRYLLPESGYVSASISSISDNSAAVSAAAGSGYGAGQKFFVNYTIPSVSATAIVTVNGSAVAATQATAATTKATAATTRATAATAATTRATAATAATTKATKPTIATTKATAATTKATAATTKATVATTEADPYQYYRIEDCNGNTWNAKATYHTPRFTYHEVGLAPMGYAGSTALITGLFSSNPGGTLAWLTRTSANECEPSGGGDPFGGGGGTGGGGGGGDNDNFREEPGGRENVDGLE